MNIYQLFVRTFGASENNECGKFSDIDDKSLNEIKSLGITHVWLTGIIRHASPKHENPQIVKGNAGSPYAVVDYYAVEPDLTLDRDNGMDEFEQLVRRIHRRGMKVIIDFIPNHLARQCKGFGTNDDTNVEFSPSNNFYYCPGRKFIPPTAPSEGLESYEEFPAKATGNDVFSPSPTANDWCDTIKLNYGIDYRDGSRHFDPIPDTWKKMLNVMGFWCTKGIDGFRVDMAEMVPVEFWRWSLAIVKKAYSPVMIAEIYQPNLYKDFIAAGFDYLYDKVGLYNCLENIYRHGAAASSISDTWKALDGLDDNMLRFMENHDEVRLASPCFIGDAYAALPAVAVSALMSRCPFMIYNGQEKGEQGEENGRTSIFNYTFMPSMANPTIDFYPRLLNLRNESLAVSKGNFYDLTWCNPWHSHFDPQFVYAFLRYFEDERLLIVVNFNKNESCDVQVKIPADALDLMEMDDNEYLAKNILTGDEIHFRKNEVSTFGISIHLKPKEVVIAKLLKIMRF